MPPAAQRTRAALAERAGLMNAEDLQRPTITVIRAKGSTSEKYNVAVDFPLQPGDVVQIGALFPAAPELPRQSGEKAAQNETPSRAANSTATAGNAAVESAPTVN
jgi:hypothetical protein